MDLGGKLGFVTSSRFVAAIQTSKEPEFTFLDTNNNNSNKNKYNRNNSKTSSKELGGDLIRCGLVLANINIHTCKSWVFADIRVGNITSDFGYSILSRKIAEKNYTCKECEDDVHLKEYLTKNSSV